jgi:peptide/nickel transport system substrate-binding protein
MLKKAERIMYEDAAFVPLHWQHLSWAGKPSLKNMDDIINVMNFPYFGDLMMQ